ncbi:MAG TPA: DUF5709 domain-containing protein [Microbacterium sp.]|nr:DUF5709 domain-containing protein [Microbacterium sp.]
MTSTDGTDYSTDDVGLLPPDESLDADELGDDVDELAYSPLDHRPADLSWGFTPREARSHEPLAARLAREIPDEPVETFGDGLGDTVDTDGELIDDQVGSFRAGRLVWAEPDSRDPAADYWAKDIGIDGGASSAEEAAIHVIEQDDRG